MAALGCRRRRPCDVVVGVISDVDAALQRLLREQALTGTDVDVVFDAPTTDWASRRSQPVVNVYLYDIREDLKRREVLNEPVYGADGRITGRRQPPRRFVLSYLLTAWTQRAEDEHRLLSACLHTLVRYDAVPDGVLAGTLAGSGSTTLLTVGLPPPGDRSMADIWSALGGELKPSLDVRIVAPVHADRSVPAGPPVLEPVTLETRAGERVERRRAGSVARRHGASATALQRRDTASVEEVLHGAGSPVETDPTATLDAPPGEVVGEDAGRWFRVRDVGR